MSQPTPLRISRVQYQRMVDAGLFHPEARVELIDGSVVEMTPQSSRHAAAVQLVEQALRSVYDAGFSVRLQMPLALVDSAPEPDLAVVRGEPREHRDAHPAAALLVVEVADTSLAHDRGRKRSVYARAAVPEYWILNLVDPSIEVHRQPSGDDYREVKILRRGESVAMASTTLLVDDLLP